MCSSARRLVFEIFFVSFFDSLAILAEGDSGLFFTVAFMVATES
jgi:hypothetical protein